jgi:hypothetical protein
MNNSKKSISVLEVFTEKMIEQAMKCKNADEIQKEVIEPNMAMINEKTGQENDSRYWAYAMEFTLNELKRKKMQ